MKKCKTCKCDLSNIGNHGERRKNFWGIYKWTYWCNKCYNDNFINEVESDPFLLAKYYNIYGKKPSEIIKQES